MFPLGIQSDFVHAEQELLAMISGKSRYHPGGGVNPLSLMR
jgi:hypothetical protein